MARQLTTQCVHRWMLGEPHYGTVRGVCRRCGTRRTFPSGLELPEAPVSYEELAASRPLAAESVSPEEHALV